MNSSEELTYVYLEAHPTDAARVLESLSIEAAAAFLQSTPLRLTIPVLRQMAPRFSKRCIELLDDTKAVGLLRGVGIPAGVSIIRQFDNDRKLRLLAQLPTSITIAYELLLSYQEGTVGAWMNPHTLALESGMTSGDMMHLIISAEGDPISTPYVVDQQYRLLGYVDIADLLRAGDSVPLVNLIKPNSYKLPAQSLLLDLQNHQGWNDSLTLPVIDRDDRLVGIMTHATLQRVLAIELGRAANQSGSDNALANVTSVYWLGISSLIQVVIGLFPCKHRKVD
jgi:magnesium transporter